MDQKWTELVAFLDRDLEFGIVKYEYFIFIKKSKY